MGQDTSWECLMASLMTFLHPGTKQLHHSLEWLWLYRSSAPTSIRCWLLSTTAWEDTGTKEYFHCAANHSAQRRCSKQHMNSYMLDLSSLSTSALAKLLRSSGSRYFSCQRCLSCQFLLQLLFTSCSGLTSTCCWDSTAHPRNMTHSLCSTLSPGWSGLSWFMHAWAFSCFRIWVSSAPALFGAKIKIQGPLTQHKSLMSTEKRSRLKIHSKQLGLAVSCWLVKGSHFHTCGRFTSSWLL